jgi:hypothetical protein
MADTTIAFLSQPVQVMAREGEHFTEEVIRTLHQWVDSKCKVNVQAERGGRVYALSSSRDAAWNLVVIVHHGRASVRPKVDVCALEFGRADSAVDHFAPLIAVDHIVPAFEMSFRKMEPKIFWAIAHGHLHNDDFASSVWSTHIKRTHLVRHLMLKVDADSHRWASSDARNNFKTLFDAAQKQPQIVERNGDEVVMLSRSYLQELVEPTSARELAIYYREKALSAVGLGEPTRRSMGPLGELPELGSA